MATHRFKCRICKKATNHTTVDEFNDGLPDGIVCVECLGCGVMGIENLINELKPLKEQLADELLGDDCA
jgi:hypothetical protein